MVRISNKAQLNSLYNRRTVITTGNDVEQKLDITSLPNVDSTAIQKRVRVYKQVERECNKPLKSKYAVTAIKTAKANDYDIVKESMRLFAIQRRTGRNDFDNIIKEREIAQYNKEVARLQRKAERENKIARLKNEQALAVKTYNKDTFSGAFAFHTHSNIVRLACG